MKQRILYQHLKDVINEKVNYTGIFDKKELCQIFHLYTHLPKRYWNVLIGELENMKWIKQVSRGFGGIKYKIG